MYENTVKLYKNGTDYRWIVRPHVTDRWSQDHKRLKKYRECWKSIIWKNAWEK